MKKSLILIFVMLLALFASTVMYAQETPARTQETVKVTVPVMTEDSEKETVDTKEFADLDVSTEEAEEPQEQEEAPVVQDEPASEPDESLETETAEESTEAQEPEENGLVNEEVEETSEEPVEEETAAEEGEETDPVNEVAEETAEEGVVEETAAEEGEETDPANEVEEETVEELVEEETVAEKGEETDSVNEVTEETSEEPVEEETAAFITVTVSGAVVTHEYDGEAYSADGYSIEIACTGMDVCEYGEGDFTFSGNASAERTEVGKSEMGLNAEQFTNNKEGVDVRFVVIDGYVEIIAKNEVVDETNNNEENTDDTVHEIVVEVPGKSGKDHAILTIHLDPVETPEAADEEQSDDAAVDTDETLSEENTDDVVIDPDAEEAEAEDKEEEEAVDAESEDLNDEEDEDAAEEDIDEDIEIDAEAEEDADADADVDDETDVEADDAAEAISAILAEYGIEGEPEVAAVKAETAIRLSADGMSVILLSPEEDLELIILGTEGDWVRVLLPDNSIGYIFYEDLEEEPVQKVYTEKKVTIFTDLGLIVEDGASINLTSLLEGFEDCTSITYRWEVDKGDGFEPVEGGDGPSYSYPATSETLNWSWHLVVSYE